jgi:hypothetical protein
MDGEPVAPQALEQHLNQCATCREQHTAALRLLDAIKQMPNPKPSANFVQSMVAQVIRDRRQRQQRVRRRVFVTMALAASVLFMLMLAYYWLPRTEKNEPQPKTPLVQQDPKKETPLPKQPEEPKKQEPRNALTVLTNRVADTTRDHAKVVLAAADLNAMEKLPAVNELPMNPNLLEAGQEVSDGVRTVTRNARKAFDFFARELPMPEIGN